MIELSSSKGRKDVVLFVRGNSASLVAFPGGLLSPDALQECVEATYVGLILGQDRRPRYIRVAILPFDLRLQSLELFTVKLDGL